MKCVPCIAVYAILRQLAVYELVSPSLHPSGLEQ